MEYVNNLYSNIDSFNKRKLNIHGAVAFSADRSKTKNGVISTT